MRRLLATVCVALLLTLSGCSGGADTTPDDASDTIEVEYNYETYDEYHPSEGVTYEAPAGKELVVVQMEFSEPVEPNGYEFFVNGNNEIPRRTTNLFNNGEVTEGYIVYIIPEGEFDTIEDAGQGDNSYKFAYNETIAVTEPPFED